MKPDEHRFYRASVLFEGLRLGLLSGRDEGFGAAQPGNFTPRSIRRQRVAADGSRRILSAAKTAPTAVGGYLRMKCPA